MSNLKIVFVDRNTPEIKKIEIKNKVGKIYFQFKKKYSSVKCACDRYESCNIAIASNSIPIINDPANGNESGKTKNIPPNISTKRKLECKENVRLKIRKPNELTSILNDPEPGSKSVEESLEQKIEQMFYETAKSSDAVPARSASSSRVEIEPDYQNQTDQLKQQLDCREDLYLSLPNRLIRTPEDQREMFRKICRRLNENVPDDQIERMYHEGNALIVRLRDTKIKERIIERAETTRIWLDKLVSGEIFWRVNVQNYMTPYYTDLFRVAQEYKKDNSLHSFKLTDKGLAIKRKENSTEKIVLSIEELKEHIEKQKN